MEQMTRDDRWVRSHHGFLAGVCEGLGARFDIEPWLLRVAFLVSLLFFFTGGLVYLGLAIALPREDRLENGYTKRVLGVCSRIAVRSQMDVGLVRFFCLILAVMSFGATIVGYIVLHFVLEEKRDFLSTHPKD